MPRYSFILLLVIFCGCASHDKKSLSAVEKDLQTIQSTVQSQNVSWDQQKQSYENLQTRLTELTNSSDSSVRESANSLLARVKDQLNRIYEEIDYAAVTEAEQQLASAASYEDEIQKIQELLARFDNFSKKYPSSSKPISVGRTRTQSLLKTTYSEKSEYAQLAARFKDSYSFLEATMGLVSIADFLQKHPNSIVASKLKSEADTMREVKVQFWSEQDFKSISSLNTAIEAVNKIMEEPGSDNDELQRTAESLEAKRPDVFKTEIEEKNYRLEGDMRSAAISEAKKQHPICGGSKDPASILGEHRTVVGTRTEITRTYVVRTSGDFACSSTYLLRIDVVGHLTGDEKVGIEYRVASSTMILETRSPY